MITTGVPVQTIGTGVTTTMYAVNGVVHLAIDSGDPSQLPLEQLGREGIVVDVPESKQ